MSEEIDAIRYQLYKRGVRGINDMSDDHVIEIFNEEFEDAPYWLCKDCHRFHSKEQLHCDIPSAQYDHASNAHDSDEVDMCETFDPSFDPFWHDDGDYKDPMLKTFRDELAKHGDQQVFKHEHTRLSQWLRQAERIRRKKTGQKTLDIHNYAESPQRSHKMTQLEKDIFTLEINAFRTARGEYRTGRKIFMDKKPLTISHLAEDEFGDRLITDEDGNIRQYKVRTNETERGEVYCTGFYTIGTPKFEEIEARVSACV